jgi:hypothetical protein
MSYSSPDPRWTRLDQSRPAPVVATSGTAGGGGPIVPLLRRQVAGEPVDRLELLDHVEAAIRDTEPVFAPRPELLALLDLADVTEADLDRDAAVARLDGLRAAPEEHAELIGAVALAAALPLTAAMVVPSSDLAPAAIGLVHTALRTPPPVRSVKEAYQHARAAKEALTAELPALTAAVLDARSLSDSSPDEPALRVVLRLFVLRRWLLETTWPHRRVCWRLLDKITSAACPPADAVTLTRLTEQLDGYAFRRWPT